MKTIDEFLSYLYSLDVKLWVDGDRLRCSVPEEALTPALSAQLQERKAEILTFLDQANLALHSSFEPIPPISRDGNLPLSFAQQRLWFLDQLQPGSSVYNIPTAVRLTGFLNIAVLEQTLNEIVRRHETLRTTFTTLEGQPVQVIAPTLTLALPLIDLRNFSEVEREAEVLRLTTEEAQQPFDLAKDPLVRITLVRLDEAEYVVLFTMHHIVSDAWSMGVLIRELAALYEAFSTGKPSPLPDLPIQYADFAAWQRQWLQGEVLEAQLSYWKQQLSGTLPVLQLPTDFPRSRVQTFRGATKSFFLPTDLTEALKALSQRANVTLFMTLLAAFKTLLHRYTGQYDILVGSPIANRNRAEIEGLIGFFVNTLVLRTYLGGNPTFRELLNQVREVTWEAYDHQDLPFEKLVEELQPERDLSYNPLFQVKFMLENAPKEHLELPGLTLSSLKQENPTAKLDLSLDMFETPLGLMGVFEYNKELFDTATINRMVGHFRTLLSGIVNNPEQRLGDLPLLTEAEWHQLLVEWNDTQTDYPKDKCFHQLFEAQVEQTPDAVAVVFENEQLTYWDLNRRSNQLAHHLNKLGVGSEVLVGICVERSLEMVVGLLGILKAGGAYVPLDPAYPKERLAFMLSDSQVPVLLTQEKLVAALPNHRAHVVCLDTDWEVISQESDRNPISGVKTENLAYLIYTSGSTGTPKGVLVTHEGLGNLTEDKIRVCEVQPDSCVLQFFSLSFDASIPEFVMALGCGAKLCLATLDSLLPGPELVQLLREQAITHITITPSALAALPAEEATCVRGFPPLSKVAVELPALQMVLVGGEACSTELIAQWSKGRLFINAYGPTEVTVNASMVECGNSSQKLPTVRPSANKQLYILDYNLQPVPIGVLGELHISGVGIARGYLNRPDKTAEAFIPNPFSKEPGSRLYKTGDLACYLPDGNIKLFGRLDNQVKIRGFRIEPGEIEALLTQHPEVRASVVIAREDNPSDKRLVAYIVGQASPPDIPSPELVPTANDLRRFLKEKLPEYMVPAAFVMLEALPLTPNGKVDHRALPAPNTAQAKLDEAFVAPRTPTEEVLAEIFAQVLEVEQVGVHDDFFELGGHSLLATKLISRLLQVFQVDLTVVDLFEAPTVVGLAEHIEKMQTREQLQASPLEIMDEREEIEL